jgi:hypothetical protein
VNALSQIAEQTGFIFISREEWAFQFEIALRSFWLSVRVLETFVIDASVCSESEVEKTKCHLQYKPKIRNLLQVTTVDLVLGRL